VTDQSRIAWCFADLPPRPFTRIVSLVPSLSEALVALGLGPRIVAVTEYCVLPEGAFDGLPKVGGTKDADVAAIRALAPDLVIANREENTERVVGKLADAGIPVWVTYPRTVRAGAELLRELAALGAEPDRIRAVVDPVFAALTAAEALRAQARRTGARPTRVFCAIWRDPWMTVAEDTYIHDLIELCGGENVFAKDLEGASGSDAPGGVRVRGREGRREGRRRYPIVELAEIERAGPELILLPSEPYAFGELDRQALRRLACPAAEADRIHLFDGALLSWYGPRIAEAIRVLGRLLAIS